MSDDDEDRAQRVARRESGEDAIMPVLGDDDTGSVNSGSSERGDLTNFDCALADTPSETEAPMDTADEEVDAAGE